MKTKFTFLFIALLLLATSFIYCQGARLILDSDLQNKSINNLEIFLLIGQSNMAGRAAIEAQDRDSLERVFLFTGIDGHEWEKAANPLNKYSTVRKDLSMQKMGPGYTFARKMAEVLTDKQIGLVVNARGGTAIAEWMPGTLLYNEAVKRTKMAMKSGNLKGIVWHQGESDVSKSDAYLELISRLIQSLRTDLGITELPFVAGQLSEDKPERKVFNQMILTLPLKVKGTAVATSEGTITFDKTHFDPKSIRMIGERYAGKMIGLMHK
jgi:hypothetical protein